MQRKDLIMRQQSDQGYISMDKSQQKTESTFENSQPKFRVEAKRTFFVWLTVELAFTLLRVAFLIALWVMVGQGDLSPLRQANGFLRMQENIALWRRQVGLSQREIITGFAVVGGYNCPEGFEEFTDDGWSGIVEGCVCGSQVGLWGYEVVLKGSCNQKEFAFGCGSVAPRGAVGWKFWRSESHLCVRRLQNYNFYSRLEDIVNLRGFPSKRCGQEEDWQVDLIAPIDCPVTTLSSSTDLPNLIPAFGFSFSSQDNYPIVGFRIAESDFCDDFSIESISPGRRSNYILQKKARKACQNVDVRTVVLDSQSQPDFLRSNPRVYDIIMRLPDYPLPDGHYTYKLGYLRYPPWTYSCRNSQQYDLFTATDYFDLDRLQLLGTAKVGIMVLLAVQLLWMIAYWASLYLYLKAKDQQGYLYLKDYQVLKANPRSNSVRDKSSEMIKFILQSALGVVLIVIFVVVYMKVAEGQDWFKGALACTSKAMGTYMTSYTSFLGSAVVMGMTSIFLGVGLVVLDGVHYLWRRWRGDLEEEEPLIVMEKEVESEGSGQKSYIDRRSPMEATEECLVALEDVMGREMVEIDRKLLFELEGQVEEVEERRQVVRPNSPVSISESCYSSNESDKSN